MKQNKILWWVATGIVAWALYAGTFDSRGNFDPVADSDVVGWRIGYRLGMASDGANQAIADQNAGVQGAVNGRAKRVHRKVDEGDQEAK